MPYLREGDSFKFGLLEGALNRNGCLLISNLDLGKRFIEGKCLFQMRVKGGGA